MWLIVEADLTTVMLIQIKTPSSTCKGFDPFSSFCLHYYTDVYKRQIQGFPVSFIMVLIVYVIMHIFLSRTALGRSIYCAGGNIEASRLSGINTANVLTFCYTLSGVMAAIAGIVSVGRSGISNGANATQPYDTDAIAACVIGGASFTGGKGTMVGTMIGCLIITVLRDVYKRQVRTVPENQP